MLPDKIIEPPSINIVGTRWVSFWTDDDRKLGIILREKIWIYPLTIKKMLKKRFY